MKIKIIIITGIALFSLIFFQEVQAQVPDSGTIFPSTCSFGQVAGPQNVCNHDNDPAILSGQCTAQYGASSCDSMRSYLSALYNDCVNSDNRPSSIDDCSLITQGGLYGRAARDMALSLAADASNPSAPSAGSATSPAGFECDSDGICFPTETGLPDPQGGVVQISTNILDWILKIFGLLAIIAFIISGIQYIFSVGDEKSVDTAKRNMKWSIVGVAVALSGVVIIYAINNILWATSTNF